MRRATPATPKLSSPISKDRARKAIGARRSRCLGSDDELLRRRYALETPEQRVARADVPEAWVYVMVDPHRRCAVCASELKAGSSFRLTGTRRLIVCGECIEISTLPASDKEGPFDGAVRQSFEDARQLAHERRSAGLTVACQ